MLLSMTTGIISGRGQFGAATKMQQETKLKMKQYVPMLGSVMKRYWTQIANRFKKLF